MFTKLWDKRPKGLEMIEQTVAENGDVCSFFTLNGKAYWLVTAADGTYSERMTFLQIGPWIFDVWPLPLGRRIEHGLGTAVLNHREIIQAMCAWSEG